MAVQEIESNQYQAIRADLSESIAVSTLAKKYKLGERRVRQIRDSKSYKGYLQKRANERRKRAENTPAKAVEGESLLAQENQQFMAEAPNGDSVPADKVKQTASGAEDLRTDEELAEAKALKRRVARQNARADEIRAAKVVRLGMIALVLFALIGVAAIVYLIANL